MDIGKFSRIDLRRVVTSYPLSPIQESLLLLNLSASEPGVYCGQLVCTLQGDLNIEAFKQAWQQVLDRHQTLRTIFVWKGPDFPLQVVFEGLELPLEYEDWQDICSADQENKLNELLKKEQSRGFNLSEAPLIRLFLYRIEEKAYRFIWNYNRLLLDTASLRLIFREAVTIYEALLNGEAVELPPSPSYKEYIDLIQAKDKIEVERFWKETLKGFTTPTPLVVDKSTSSLVGQAVFNEQQIELSTETTAFLQALEAQHGLSLNTIIIGAWGLLLSRYSGEKDVVFGATVSGRPSEIENAKSIVGPFINIVPVRINVEPEAEVLSWLKNVKERRSRVWDYEFSSLVQVQTWSELSRELPMFDSCLFLHSFQVDDGYLQRPNASFEVNNARTLGQIDFPLNIKVLPGDQVRLRFTFDERRFDNGTISRMMGHLKTIVENITNPKQRLCDLSILTKEERQQILVEWNNTRKDSSVNLLIHQLFEEQVEKNPDAIAVVFGEQKLTYSELNSKANQLAHYLRSFGIGPEILVGVCVERSLEMIIGMLGVIKSGGAYVPMDPSYPLERLSYMLEDAQIPVLLTQEHLLDQLPSHWGQTISLDADWDNIDAESDENPVNLVKENNLAYVIYTSGSTGKPKGVLIEHRGVPNLVEAQKESFEISSESRVLQFASFGFDASVSEVFVTLLAGATLYLAPQDSLMPGPLLLELIREQQITSVTLPPSVLAILPSENLSSLKSLITAGEACSADIVERWAKERKLLNAYGPTEATVCATIAECVANKQRPSIGRPISNVEIYILDEYLQPVPVGVPGELHISSIGLARGYLNQPQLTAQKFIHNPFSNDPDAKLYKSGDLARYLPNGDIDFLGRIDHQVKIRGFRIELGEIEEVLRQHPSIQEVIIIARQIGEESESADLSSESEDKSRATDKQLVAYLIVNQYNEPSISELRSFVKQKLPDYMVPAFFIFLESFPLTPSGKVDRLALPSPDESRADLQDVTVAPRDALELQLLQMWEEILEIRSIGVTDNFFYLGGNSLLAMRLLAQIERIFGEDLPLSLLFQEPTIEHLAGVLRRQGGYQPSPLVKIQTEGSKPPFFCMHPVGGSVICYYELARHMGTDYPLYGLQAIGLDGEQEPSARIEDMVAQYLKAVRSIQPEGPYFLGGWSMGGVLAFEMAQQLQEQGQRIGMLVLMDSWAPMPDESRPVNESEAVLLTRFARDLGGRYAKNLIVSEEIINSLDYNERFNYVLEQAKKSTILPQDTELTQIKNLFKVYQFNIVGARSYVPEVYTNQITFFRSMERQTNMFQDPVIGWKGLSSEPIKVYDIPGSHYTILAKPYVQTLSDILKQCFTLALQPKDRGVSIVS
jgi:amino acid adenylation domain-containing protein